MSVDLSGFSFTDIEADIAKVLDPLTAAAVAVSKSEILKLILNAEQQEVLNEIVAALQFADGLLHKTP